MEGRAYDFGSALSVDAEAIGALGRRRFRLTVRSAGNTAASLWLEKEQLRALGEALVEMGGRLEKERPTSEKDVRALPAPLSFEVEMRVGRLALAYLEEDDAFRLQAFAIDQGEEETRPAFQCSLSRGQSRVLARTIRRVVEAGRPLCPLCQAPIDPEGHVCPRANGHFAGAMRP
jgi:uncharacterized repeat protein (TIGR03847 family)